MCGQVFFIYLSVHLGKYFFFFFFPWPTAAEKKCIGEGEDAELREEVERVGECGRLLALCSTPIDSLGEVGTARDLVLFMCLSALLRPRRFSAGTVSSSSSSLLLVNDDEQVEAFPPSPSLLLVASWTVLAVIVVADVSASVGVFASLGFVVTVSVATAVPL